MQVALGMRNLTSGFFLTMALVAGCAEGDRDVADMAVDDGEDLGEEHATDLEIELASSSDEEIAGKSGAIMMAINDAQLLLVDLVLDVSADPVVLDFADSMLVAHHEHLVATGDLMIELGISPIETAISFAVVLEAERNRRELGISTDFDFDFMRMEVAMHSESLVIVDTLLRFASHTEAQLFLDDALSMLSDHRSEAAWILRGF